MLVFSQTDVMHKLKKSDMKNILLSIFIYLCFVDSYGQIKDSNNLIDTNLSKCLNSEIGQTTSGMINCTIAARNSWDAELNKYYKLLMVMLSAEEKEKLKIAQKKWITYRDSEIEFSGIMYHNLNGSMWGISAADRITEIVKVRAKELEEYYEVLPKVRQ